MKIVDIASVPAWRVPIPNGPTIRRVPGDDTAAAVMHVTLPAGAGMPEHDHGPSRVMLIPLSGRARLHHNGAEHDLRPTRAVTIDIGERVSLDNPWPEEATVIVVATPPDFIETLTAGDGDPSGPSGASRDEAEGGQG